MRRCGDESVAPGGFALCRNSRHDRIMSTPTQPQWEIVATLFDAPSAHAMLTLFERQGVPVNIVGDSPLLGEVRRCEILVPSTLAHRARWLLAQPNFSDAELTFLATGELGVNDDDAAT